MSSVLGMPRLNGVGIGFDLDHTLLIDNHLERLAFLRLLELVVDHGGRLRGTYEQEVRHIDAMLTAQRSAAYSIEDAVLRFAREREVDAPEAFIEHFKTIAVQLVDAVVVPLPRAKQVLRELRRHGASVAILSNGWNPLQERKARRLGFDGPVLASAEIGAQKPDPRAFAALLKALDLPASRCWYVGDDPRIDVAGALAAGLRAIWLDAEGHPYPEGAPPPTRTIRSLDDLVEAVTRVSTPGG